MVADQSFRALDTAQTDGSGMTQVAMTRVDGKSGQAEGAVSRSPPADAYTFSPAVVTVSDPSGPQAEAIRGMRTHIMAQHVNRGRRALAVRPEPGCRLHVRGGQSGDRPLTDRRQDPAD